MHRLILIFFILYNMYYLAITSPIFGENVKYSREGQFPFVVSIKRHDFESLEPEFEHVCSGAIISKQDVVSCDHCKARFENHIAEVAVGSFNIRRAYRYFISWWLSFNEWADIRQKPHTHEKNDITVIRLNRTIIEDIVPIPLTRLSDNDLAGAFVTVAAFGRSKTNVMTRFMETANFTILSKNECNNKITSLGGTEFQVCRKYICGAAEPAVLMSKGNSGGPVFYNGELIGLHKATCPNHENHFHPEKVNVLMSIPYYRGYIIDVIRSF